MYTKMNLYAIGLVVILIINHIAADVDDNEVHDSSEYHMLQGIRVYPNEHQCAMVGGLCVPISDCNEPTTNRGLCPSNTHRGVECCYELKLDQNYYKHP